MRILSCADWHLSEIFPRNIQHAQSLALTEILKAYREHNCSVLKVLGDIIHDKSFMYASSINLLDSLIRENPDINFEFTIGNHDFAGDSSDHGFYALRHANNVRIIDKPLERTIASRKIVDLPYSKTLKKLLPDFSGDFLFSHFGVNEAMVSPGFSVSHPIRFSDLQSFREVQLGHYHLPQEHTVAETTLRYTGSLVSRDWSDKNQEKRYLITDLETTEVSSHPVKSSPRFIELTVETLQELREAEEKFKTNSESTFIRVITSLDLESDSLQIVKRASDTTNLNSDFVSSDSSETLLKKWVETELKDSSLTSEEVLQFGMSIFSRAQEFDSTSDEADADDD